MKKLVKFSLIILVFSTSFSYSDVLPAGYFLSVPFGARASAMGGTFVGISDDISSLYWNPAGLGKLKFKQCGSMYNRWLEGISLGYLGYAHPTPSLGTYGVLVSYYDSGDIPKILADSRGVFQERSGSFKAVSYAVSLAFGKKQGKNLYYGGALKIINERIDIYSATSFAGDLGALWDIIEDKVTIGFSMLNLGTKLKFIEVSSPLPLDLRLGLSYSLVESGNILLAADYSSRDGVHTGAEYSIGLSERKKVKKRGYYFKKARGKMPGNQFKREKAQYRISFRAGCKIDNLELFDPAAAYTFGFGLNMGIINIGYTFNPLGYLGNTSNFFMNFRFGGEVRKRKKSKKFGPGKLLLPDF